MITLPKPPSINHIYGYTNRGGFARSYITAKGKRWFKEAGLLLKRQWRKKIIKGNVGVYIVLYTIRQDVDGIIKPVLDLLEECGVIENDNQVDFLQVEKVGVHHRREERITLEIDNN